MSITKYIESLIANGTWSQLTTEAQSILLLILAKYKDKPIHLSYREIQEATGVSKSIVKDRLEELTQTGLIHKEGRGYVPTADLDNSGSGLPLPPTNPEEDSGTYTDLMEWVEEYIIGNPLGALLGGALLYYLIKLWMEYIRSKQDTDRFTAQSSFITQAMTADYGFTKINRSLYELNFPHGIDPSPADLAQLFS
jgi:DNA-binding Lrp family transcriptional regulator